MIDNDTLTTLRKLIARLDDESSRVVAFEKATNLLRRHNLTWASLHIEVRSSNHEERTNGGFGFGSPGEDNNLYEVSNFSYKSVGLSSFRASFSARNIGTGHEYDEVHTLNNRLINRLRNGETKVKLDIITSREGKHMAT